MCLLTNEWVRALELRFRQIYYLFCCAAAAAAAVGQCHVVTATAIYEV